ncbi:MAG: DUF6544 family protein [Asgard group archaeon]|nr:DUF6544 family protein [Asgard group archaeon]
MAKNNDIKQLFNLSKNISNNPIKRKQLHRVPKPMQRYFHFALPERRTHISYARLKHGGKFKQKTRWTTIKGEEYFTTEKPGFVWIGKVPFFQAKDKYLNGKGELTVKLFSFIQIIQEKGAEVTQGELLRWLGEAPWYPTALLPSDRLRWEEIDEKAAKAILTDGQLQVEGQFFVNKEGKITHFKAKRYKEGTLENWTGYYRNYQLLHGVRVPTNVEVAWNLEEGDISYAKFSIEKIEYDIPEPF